MRDHVGGVISVVILGLATDDFVAVVVPSIPTGSGFPVSPSTFAPSMVQDRDFVEAFEALANPAKTAFLVAMRVVHPGDLERGGKEIFVNKSVVIGEKNAKPGMRVVPAHNAMVGYFASLVW